MYIKKRGDIVRVKFDKKRFTWCKVLGLKHDELFY
nr:MAG TPA: immunity protein [Caudoviricetes sp.]